MKETMSAPEAARTLNYGLNYLYSLILAGRIPATKVDGKWQIEARHVRARIAAMDKRESGSAAAMSAQVL